MRPDAAIEPPGHLAENVMHFARVLRSAGMPIGTDRIQLALRALQVAGLRSREDFHATLFSCFVSKAEQRALFDQAFHIFWRDPDLLGRVMAMLLPRAQGKAGAPSPPENRRLAQALFPGQGPPSSQQPQERIEFEAAYTWSDREVLRHTDFESMSAEEWLQAKRLLAELRLAFEPLHTRRYQRSSRGGRADWRATLRDMARCGDQPRLSWQRPRLRPPQLVVLADISGSMSRYSRMLLHFAHAATRGEAHTHSFVFGTRLTAITRMLAQRDPDIAVAQVARAVQDWSGGTRISACLHEFNRHWSRRVLGGGNATVLLISDGLEHGDSAALAFEMERLHKSCRRLVWLNPLLRYDGFEPKAAGIRAMLPHVDHFVPAHNLASLDELARLLRAPAPHIQDPATSIEPTCN
ncbi:MAG TPA: VWA domain-containing protein [Methylibium sp.]